MRLPDTLALEVTLPDGGERTIEYRREPTGPQYAYIAETIWDGENVWDGRERHGLYRSQEAALAAWRIEAGEPGLVATEWHDPSAHPVADPHRRRTWMVHEEGTAPDETGHRWIFEERLW